MAVENNLKSFAIAQNRDAKPSWLLENCRCWPFNALLGEIINQPTLLLILGRSD
jgi:hypothetical protein